MKYKILERTNVYSGFFRIDRYRLRHSLFTGGEGPELTRELFERGHSVGVLPYDPARDQVVLVEQFRIGALESPRGPWLVEIIAGMVEEGETALDVARRETQEESGCVIDELIPVAQYFVSPGGTSEQVSVFCGRVSCEGVGGIHGKPEEGEDIRVLVVDLDEALEWVQSGVINAAMPIIALQWLAMNRQRLRQEWSG